MRKFLLVLGLLGFIGFGSLFSKEANIAAAANLKLTLGEIEKAFLSIHKGDKLNISYSASGKFYAQIVNGAPFDLFISADEDFPKKLVVANQTPEKEQIYAQGVLVLWSANPKIKITSLQDLVDKKIIHIVLPNPELAPYGRAGKQALEKSKLYDILKTKLINASSISQAHQFVSSGAGEAGFGAFSLIDKKDENVSYILVDKSLYSPINQALVLTNYGKNNELAKEFKAFILGPQAKKIFEKYGYIIP